MDAVSVPCGLPQQANLHSRRPALQATVVQRSAWAKHSSRRRGESIDFVELVFIPLEQTACRGAR